MRTQGRSRERGTAMVVMLVVLVALGTIAGLTVVSVQGGAATANTQRFSSMAMYAAESGAAAAMHYLKTNVRPQDDPNATRFFSTLVTPNNDTPESPAGIPGNNIQPGPGNLLSNDQQGWYQVTLLNNRGDPGFTLGQDLDGIITVQVIGHGPNGAVKKLEWDVRSQLGEVGKPLMLLGWREVL